MGAAIGTGLGLLLGGAMGYERQKRQAEWMNENREAQFQAQMLKEHPEAITIPSVQQNVKKLFGQPSVEILQKAYETYQQQSGQGRQIFGGGGGAAQPAQASIAKQPSAGAQLIASTAAPTGLPEGMTREKFFTLSPAEQKAYVERASAAGPTAAMRGEGAAAPVAASVSDLDEQIGHLNHLIGVGSDYLFNKSRSGHLDADTRKAYEKELDEWTKKRDELQKEQRDERSKLAAEARKPTLAAKTRTAVLGAETTPEALAAAAKKAETTKAAELAATAAAPKTAAELRQEQKDIESQQKDLFTERQSLLKSAATTTTDPSALGPAVHSYNHRAAEFAERNPAQGPPQLIHYELTPPGAITKSLGSKGTAAMKLSRPPTGAKLVKDKESPDGGPVFRLPNGKFWTP